MSDERTIDVDLYGTGISQAVLDQVFAEIRSRTDHDTVDLVIRNIRPREMPHLIVDYGQIYNALVKFLGETK